MIEFVFGIGNSFIFSIEKLSNLKREANGGDSVQIVHPIPRQSDHLKLLV